MVSVKSNCYADNISALSGYNHLNLPTLVEINGPLFTSDDDNGVIEYVYDATGTKLEKKVSEYYSKSIRSVECTRYAGHFVYVKRGNLQSPFKLSFFNQPEGYVERNGSEYDYVYQYKDHLGNIRLTYMDNNGSLDIIEEHNYYPFGGLHKGYNDVVSANVNSVAQKFKYNGKELEESLGYGMYEYEARHYDPWTARFVTIDPLAEDYNFQSTYAYAINNPIFFIDKLGMGPWIPNGDGTWTAEAGDSASTLSRDAGISFERAKEIMASTPKENSSLGNMGTYIDTKDGVEKSAVDPGDIVAIPEQVEEHQEIASIIDNSSFSAKEMTKDMVQATDNDEAKEDMVNWEPEKPDISLKGVVKGMGGSGFSPFNCPMCPPSNAGPSGIGYNTYRIILIETHKRDHVPVLKRIQDSINNDKATKREEEEND
ncbi:RHS repeat-associated core domain-containing protein [Winogradskyella sp.]|uniref:RHS repeat domain-containing protein n=1 Tax=Winogradskyella sp. TaxID=1883156 RepID=UPI00262332DC|nr:RHS repeat-associated core domain-containing protein [Winogradskyella sp.]